VFLAVIAGTLAGCGQNKDAAAVQSTVQNYLTALMAKQFDKALTYTSGAARVGLSSVKADLAKADYSDTVHKLNISVEHLDTKNGYATVMVSYELEENVPGAGTSWDKDAFRYDLTRINGRWYIYNTTEVSKTAMK